MKKILLKVAFAMGLVMFVQGLEIHYKKRDYHFGDHKDGDVTILADQKAVIEKKFRADVHVFTYVVPPPDKELKDKLPSENVKDPQYIPIISQIVITDKGSGSAECKILNGGVGRHHVTFFIVNHVNNDIDYEVTLIGQ